MKVEVFEYKVWKYPLIFTIYYTFHIGVNLESKSMYHENETCIEKIKSLHMCGGGKKALKKGRGALYR